ncbi:hypothetical protein G6M86_27435 (plasmid) [Agrobacterium tumefaciens]|uniref:DNA polymerase Y-family little finger domain-containing protein n=1 Tax=Agrobacterium tumefaciens TaxID=358 RepID=A0AAJ4N8B3_AGRTU|nr:hypothetical protein G6M86_27435 [Agrobacterium tumefaciens]
MSSTLSKWEARLLAEEVWRRYKTIQVSGKTVTVKIKYSDFTQAPAVALPPPPLDDRGIFRRVVRSPGDCLPIQEACPRSRISLGWLIGEHSGDEDQPQLDLDL